MNNIALGKYIPGKSFIHKLDPRSKIFIMILLMVIIFWNVGQIFRFPLYILLSIIIKAVPDHPSGIVIPSLTGSRRVP